MDDDIKSTLPISAPSLEQALVRQHALIFMFDFPCIEATHLPRINGLTLTECDPDGTIGIVHPEQRERAKGQFLFEPNELSLSPDLHPSVRAVLTSRVDPSESATLPCRSLTTQGRRLLNGEWAQPPGDPRQQPGYGGGKGLTVPLGREARQRVETAAGSATPFLRIQVDTLDLLMFRSDTGMALLRCTVIAQGAVRLVHVQEALHILSNVGRPRSVDWACRTEPVGRFTLETLMGALLAPAGCVSQPWNRLYTLAYVQLDDELDRDTLDLAAWRLSRHYNSAYAHGPDYRTGTSVLRPFATVAHAASVEGVATVVTPSSTFLRDVFASRVDNCYLPLALLAFHEHVQLLAMTERAAVAHASEGRATADRKHLDALQRLTDQFLSFRLSYRLAMVSDVTMHNQYYRMVRAGLEVDALTQKLAGDTTDAARALLTAQTRAAAAQTGRHNDEHLAREQGRAWLLGIFAGLLTFLTSLAAFKEVKTELGEQLPEMHPPHELVLLWPLLLATLLGLLSAILTARRHKDAHSGGQEEDEIGEELQADARAEGGHVAGETLSRGPPA